MDHNGEISFAEAHAYLKFNGMTDQEKVLKTFAESDLNGDGCISKSEFDSSLA